MEADKENDPVKDYQKYQAIRSNTINLEVEYQPFNEKEIAEQGSQPFGKKSNCGSKTIFSFAHNIRDIDSFPCMENLLTDLLLRPDTLPYCLTIMRFNETDEIKCSDGNSYTILDMRHSNETENDEKVEVVKLVCEMMLLLVYFLIHF